MANDDLLRELEACGALARGHFLLSSGLHSPAYVQCALLLALPERARKWAKRLAERVQRASIEVDSVLSPALGGVIIGHEVAAALGVPFRFVERSGGDLVLRRGFELVKGERVLVVEDVVTTGKSTRETAEVARTSGAVVTGVASILDRSGGAHGFDAPYVALLELDLPIWAPNACPRCAEGSLAVKPGSRPSAAG